MSAGPLCLTFRLTRLFERDLLEVSVKIDFGGRANANFAASREAISSGIKAMAAEHSAKGILRSGATVKRSVSILEDETSKALRKSLEEMAARIEHRGREWGEGIAAIRAALEEHLTFAPALLEGPLKFARASDNNAVARAADRLVSETSERLRQQLQEFQDGWTAPRAKTWKERNPQLDRLAFTLIGAIAGAATQWLLGL